ncbi:DegV domain-containing protein YitS [Halobacillus andaensis]|uniref:DegV domain-containing protein YitS n=1 Tax=Halobacillus andaensis TaxID=1176239 RepID=A0A917B3A9_HALAA|nr:DegV family protein [Halobacillus andaensis]MBP2004083.1 DegV family protein with EDD domain [Halobacillus andaensis]GGF15651.1 DegV domain-containing protein YitS [Halobacillus andaensis]
MNVSIISDSACDLSLDYLHKINVECLPLGVTIGDKEYEDGKTITPEKVYSLMKDGEAPKTSQVSPEAFRQTFTNYVEKDQPFLYFALSSELSGTYHTAKMIEQEIKEEHPDAKFEVIDTKAASLGYGLIVMRAAELAQEGKSFEEIQEIGQYYAEHMEHIFTVDDLEYLYRGGRVSKTAAFVGSLLRIKPLLHVEDGKLIPLEKIRGSKKVLKRMVDMMKERGLVLDQQRIAISHGDDIETAQKLADMIKEECGTKDIHIEMIGAVIGAHAGPGTIALFFLNDEPK